MGEDWSAVIRKQENVQEYILIGEHGEQAGCGDPVLTWGAGRWVGGWVGG